MHNMNPESRMWFYGLKQPMSLAQKSELSAIMDEFVSSWKAHGSQLAAAFRIVFDQFLIIAVDESQQQATGCSIDKSVHLLQAFGKKHEVDFFNRMLIFVQSHEGFVSFSPSELKVEIANNNLDGSSIVLNTQASTIGSSGDGTMKLKDSWAGKYL